MGQIYCVRRLGGSKGEFCSRCFGSQGQQLLLTVGWSLDIFGSHD